MASTRKGEVGRLETPARGALQRRRSEPSEANSLAKKRAGSRAWSPIAAKASVERALPFAPAHERAERVRPGVMALYIAAAASRLNCVTLPPRRRGLDS